MKHVMFDLETMGSAPGCAILSIGAIAFDLTGEQGATFYSNVDLDSCLRAGLTVDASTIKWWMQQSEAARLAAIADGPPLEDVLTAFSIWFQQTKAECIWCHGATFDAPILEIAYRKVGRTAPWRYHTVRDTRTILDLTGVKVLRDSGVHHNALDDCRSQIVAVATAYSLLAPKETP